MRSFIKIYGPWVLVSLLSLCLLAYIAQLVKPCLEERLPDEFSVSKIALDMEGDFYPSSTSDFPTILSQSYSYLGHGGQAVAFASEDGQYVLKFFLKRSMHGKKRYPVPKPTHWIKSHAEARKKEREQKAFRSLSKAMRCYTEAFLKMDKLTGILSLHLLATKGDPAKVLLYDAYRNEHFVDLNRASFVFQKRAMLVPEKLKSLSTDEEKIEALRSLERFFANRAKMGFIDIERSFMIEANYGFLGNEPIQIDIGNIEYVEEIKNSPEKEILRIQGLLRDFAKKQSLPSF